MPGAPRQETIDESVVGIYHTYNRCSQRARLHGYDPLTGMDYSHRKQWMRDGMKALAACMAVDVLDYAILDNHFHLVLRNRPDLVASWSDEEVVRRWWLVCSDRRGDNDQPKEFSTRELKAILSDYETVQEYRKRLSSISWFMRMLCQPIARRANKESNVTGRFFAHRFGCERILDIAGLLACSMYVDLNLVRAGIAKTPEESEFTSAFDRIQARAIQQQLDLGQQLSTSSSEDAPDDWLAPLFLDERSDAYGSAETPLESAATSAHHEDHESRLERRKHESQELVNENGDIPSLGAPLSRSEGLAREAPSDSMSEASSRAEFPPPIRPAKRRIAQTMRQGNPLGFPRASEKGFLPITVDEYLELLDWTGRQVRADKRAAIPTDLKPILERLQVQPEHWLATVQSYDQTFRTAVGRVTSIRREAVRRGKRWLQGLTAAAVSFL